VLADAQSVWVDVNASDAWTDSGRTPAPATTEDPSEAGKTDDQKKFDNCNKELQTNIAEQLSAATTAVRSVLILNLYIHIF
jgi:hypothetical protein